MYYDRSQHHFSIQKNQNDDQNKLKPLWSYKPFVFKPESSTINAIILILAIGLPLSFIAQQYYSKNKNSSA